MADVFQKFLSLSHEERVDAARGAAAQICDFCEKQGLSNEETVSFFCNVTKLFVSVDRSCEQGEYVLFNDITGFQLSTDEFFKMTNYGSNSEFVQSMLECIKAMDEDTRYAVAVFGGCICSADGEMTDDEKRMIASVL